jgi:hypothetical protein
MEVGVCKIGVRPELDVNLNLVLLILATASIICLGLLRKNQRLLQTWQEYCILLFSAVLLLIGMTTCNSMQLTNQYDKSLDSNFRILLAGIGMVLLLLLLFKKEKMKKSTILLIGKAGAGKTVLTWGLIKYLGEIYPNFCHGADSDNKALMKDVESDFADGVKVRGTMYTTANKISFSLNPHSKKEYVIYDFGGEQIHQASPVTRQKRTTKLFQSMDLDIFSNMVSEEDLEAYGPQKLVIDRRTIKHIVFLIHPAADGSYPHRDVLSSLQSNIQLVEELTMRTSHPLHSNVYSDAVKKYRNQAHRIRIHCFFTQYSNRGDAMGEEDIEAELKEISTDLNRLINQSKGTRRHVNVIRKTEAGDKFEKDFYMVDEVGKALMR